MNRSIGPPLYGCTSQRSQNAWRQFVSAPPVRALLKTMRTIRFERFARGKRRKIVGGGPARPGKDASPTQASGQKWRPSELFSDILNVPLARLARLPVAALSTQGGALL